MRRFPRVLIIGQTFDKSGGGITLANLFKGWPSDRIAIADTSVDDNDTAICDNTYLLGALETGRPWPFSLFQSKMASGRVIRTPGERDERAVSSLDKNELRSAIRLWYRTAQRWIGIYYYINKIVPSAQFLDWVRDFNPDLIYTQLASLSCIRLVDYVNLMTGKPIVIHIMDDWPVTIVKPGLFSGHWRTVIDREFRQLIDRSAGLMSICQAMSDEYESRYGRPFTPFHNPIDLSMWTGQSKMDWHVGKPARILYAGRLGNVNLRSIIDICNAVTELRAEGQDIVFEIRSSDAQLPSARILERYSNVELNSYIKHSDMPAKLRGVDLLIIPLDFNERNIKFTQFSMPGKTSDYMASGTPVLVYAPPQNALVKYARNDTWGYVVDQRDNGLLKQAILTLLTDISMREALGRKAIEVAFKNHSADVVRQAFQDLIRKSVVDNRRIVNV
jgi:glycosyltransferase involved in cell wall biosynthesis